MSDVDGDARRIAERGRDALLARLRPAFREAAGAQHDEVGLDDAQLEQMVQHAADEADALQWRRALAAAAMDELGLGLGEALEHPAVARAHEIVGAPSYEDAVASLGLGTPDPAQTPGPAQAQPEPSLKLVCTHLGGIADLASPEEGVELWFSEPGLDIIRSSKEPLGRLQWGELRSIEVVDARGRFALRRAPHTYLVIRGAQGDASFEVPGSSAAKVRHRLAELAGQNVRII